MKKKLAIIHTVNWYNKSVIDPFVKPWLEKHPEVELINIMDDSLLTESLANGGPTKKVIERMLYYFKAAEVVGADVIMSSCTTMGPATRVAREFIEKPIFNIDEPMAKEAIKLGKKFGILATVPTSAPATQKLLQIEATTIGKDIQIETIINRDAFAYLLEGKTEKHNEIIFEELSKLQQKVDVIVLGQISLAQIKFDSKVPMLQVGHSGIKYAEELLNKII